MAPRPPAPVVLHGRYTRLEPLTAAHVPDLHLAGSCDDGLWQWLPVVTPYTLGEMTMLVEQRLAQQAAGGAVMFAIIPAGTERAAGWVAYTDVAVADERLDIGWHWAARSTWDTPVTAETQLLLLRHAFEHLAFGRVQWQIDHLDIRAQLALSGLGAVREGPLRRHARRSDGTWRDTLVYAMLANEWRGGWGAGLF
ncbi:GNAT family N-acetyltransferase [Kitasatospora camelliae]|uniref:GNAT family protein n=1 Tax=Kitasatospora camelliae TaxID=3156397 RepID=A0AAU8JQH6_9ACTN